MNKSLEKKMKHELGSLVFIIEMDCTRSKLKAKNFLKKSNKNQIRE